MVRGSEKEFASDTPHQLILYNHDHITNSSPGSSNNVSPPNTTNCSLNSSSTTNTNSTCSITRQLNKKNISSNHDLITTITKSSNYNYDQSPISHISTNQHQQDDSEDFLPICDALFNVICLVAYFCDIVFDVLAAYTFYQEGLVEWSIVASTFIILSMVMSQVVSCRWYLENYESRTPSCSTSILIILHFCLCGVLWRYFKLFIPVDLRYVKSEVRDLCLLRLIHAFTESSPMLVIQLYLTFLKSSSDHVTDLTIVSTALSLFMVCWALASFSKNVRRQNVHKLVLTWLGVIFQFFWRLGTITSRVLTLAVYATVYGKWTFLVITLHWFSMLMWLISPKNIFHGEKMSIVKKVSYSAVIAIVYIFCYINVQEVNSRQKVLIFYVTMFLENTLLMSVWLIAGRNEEFWFKNFVILFIFLSFISGIIFMSLYYKYFHVKKLNYVQETTGNTISQRGSSILMNNNSSSCNYYSSASLSQFETNSPVSNYNGQKRNEFLQDSTQTFIGLSPVTGKEKNRPKPYYNKINGHHIHHPNVPGVFNCRFNPAMKRKKKKPTSFVPPPPPVVDVILTATLENDESITFTPSSSTGVKKHSIGVTRTTTGHRKMVNPFWKRPVSIITICSENEGSVSSRVDIHRKLQEKKQQQLLQLRQIEEEIKNGKLMKPNEHIIFNGEGEGQPIPFEKKVPWFRGGGGQTLSSRPPIVMPSNNDELLLDPYLLFSHQHLNGEGSPSGFYERAEWNNYSEPLYQNDEDGGGFSEGEVEDDVMGESISDMMNERHSHKDPTRKRRRKNGQLNAREIYKSWRISSDVESQVSLPRSLTLPRKFKYERKVRKMIKTEHFMPSTNSSDGDVDSGEEDSQIYADVLPYGLPYPSVHHVRLPSKSAQSQRFPLTKKSKQPQTPL